MTVFPLAEPQRSTRHLHHIMRHHSSMILAHGTATVSRLIEQGKTKNAQRTQSDIPGLYFWQLIRHSSSKF